MLAEKKLGDDAENDAKSNTAVASAGHNNICCKLITTKLNYWTDKSQWDASKWNK